MRFIKHFKYCEIMLLRRRFPNFCDFPKEEVEINTKDDFMNVPWIKSTLADKKFTRFRVFLGGDANEKTRTELVAVYASSSSMSLIAYGDADIYEQLLGMIQ